MTSNRIFYIKEHLLADTSIIFAWMYSISFIFIYIYFYVWGTPFDWLLVVCVAGWNQPESMWLSHGMTCREWRLWPAHGRIEALKMRLLIYHQALLLYQIYQQKWKYKQQTRAIGATNMTNMQSSWLILFWCHQQPELVVPQSGTQAAGCEKNRSLWRNHWGNPKNHQLWAFFRVSLSFLVDINHCLCHCVVAIPAIHSV